MRAKIFDGRTTITWHRISHYQNLTLKLFQLDLPSAMPLDCIANFGFFGSLILQTALPLLIIVLLVGISNVLRFKKLPKLADMCSSGWFFLLFLVYPSCSTAVFQTFMCDLLDDGSAYLRVDYSVQCYSEDGAYDEDYLSMMIWAGVMAVIYPIGTPLLFAAVLYANREAIAKAEKLECVLMTKCEAKLKMATDDDKRREVSEENAALIDEVEQQIRSTNLKGGCLKLTNGYELRCSWFEVFECGRKICLVGIPVFVDNGSASQLIMGLLVCFISAMMYASYEPFVSESDDRLSKICQTSLFFSLVSSIALKMEPDSSQEVLGVLLLIMLAVPPVIAFLFESDLDFEEGCHMSTIKKISFRVFDSTFGRCCEYLFEVSPEGTTGLGRRLSKLTSTVQSSMRKASVPLQKGSLPADAKVPVALASSQAPKSSLVQVNITKKNAPPSNLEMASAASSSEEISYSM